MEIDTETTTTTTIEADIMDMNRGIMMIGEIRGIIISRDSSTFIIY